MLYHLFDYLSELPGARLFQYISFRAGLAIVISLLISMLFGKRIIDKLRQLQIGETVRDLGLEGQKQKEGTPTMGGILIILAILVPTLLLANINNVYIVLMILSTLWMGAIGFIDDYIKVFLNNKKGLSGKFKIIGQVGLGLIVGATMFFHQEITIRVPSEVARQENYQVIREVEVPSVNGRGKEEMVKMAYVKTTLTTIPFLKNNELDYSQALFFLKENKRELAWLIFIPVVIFIVTAVSNAANLTDGLDGLATGISGIIAAALGVLAYVSGNTIAADYLSIFYLPNSGELVIFSASFLGACIGFLWHNAYPAKVFMGDTGSLTLGGIIAALAILLRKELLIPLLCGVFLIESLSVILQVSYFKFSKRKTGEGKRVFLMAPIHHHYQKKGLHEAKIVTRFWIVGILLTVLTLITLKVR